MISLGNMIHFKIKNQTISQSHKFIEALQSVSIVSVNYYGL